MHGFDSSAHRERVRKQMAHLRTTTRPVAEHFALVPALHREFAVEFIEPDQSRWLVLPTVHPLAVNHQHLTSQRLPVLPAHRDDEVGLFFIQVPVQARRLPSLAQHLRQTPHDYQDILFTAGRILQRLSKVVPPGEPYNAEHGLLDQFAVAKSNHADQPDIIFLVPPYSAMGVPAQNTLRYLQREFIAMGLSGELARQLSDVMYQGWQQAEAEANA